MLGLPNIHANMSAYAHDTYIFEDLVQLSENDHFI